MRALHIGLRVADRAVAVEFYEAVGYEVIGEVPETGIGHLTMLKLPEDPFATLELVHDPSFAGDLTGGVSHLVIQVPSMASTVAALGKRGIAVDPPSSPDGSDDFLTTFITDPDGRKIELVQWPADHPGDGITAEMMGG